MVARARESRRPRFPSRPTFAKESWGDKATRDRISRTVKLLHDVIARLGAAAQGKGNVVERLVLERLAASQAATVTDLPFIKPFLASEQREVWSQVTWSARSARCATRLQTYSRFRSSRLTPRAWSGVLARSRDAARSEPPTAWPCFRERPAPDAPSS